MAVFCVTSLRLFKSIQTIFSRHVPKSMIILPFTQLNIIENVLIGKNLRYYSENGFNNPFGKPEVAKKKTVPVPKILLLSSEGKIIGESTVEDAHALAKRRGLNLIQIVDVELKTKFPIYQLMTKAQIVGEEKKAKVANKESKSMNFKESKLIVISSKIDKHDLETRIRKIIKLLEKKHKVQVHVSLDENKAGMDKVVKSVEDEVLKQAIVKDKAIKSSGVKLYLEPLLPIEINETKIDAE